MYRPRLHEALRATSTLLKHYGMCAHLEGGLPSTVTFI